MNFYNGICEGDVTDQKGGLIRRVERGVRERLLGSTIQDSIEECAREYRNGLCLPEIKRNHNIRKELDICIHSSE
jgi:hypothetical protein